MKKIAIYVCGEISERCTANGCLRAFNDRADSFEVYGPEATGLVAFGSCNGCEQDPEGALYSKLEKFLKAEVDTMHLSTCIRGRCDHYEAFVKILSKNFDVIGYTHGSQEGRKKYHIDEEKILS